jgi:hypothetical protein
VGIDAEIVNGDDVGVERLAAARLLQKREKGLVESVLRRTFTATSRCSCSVA